MQNDHGVAPLMSVAAAAGTQRLRRPKALACLIETSPGGATEGTRGHEGCAGRGRYGAPHRWARPLRAAQ